MKTRKHQKMKKKISRKQMSGSNPDCGAIFMSNRMTIEECFEKKLFGLPYVQSDFVRGVKKGMILFLFEYEERKLYGVFEATSDGKMNIIPEAYTSSGKRFPAQVEFTTLWDCEPLAEDEFSGAIRDNYFTDYKFEFGLSKDQIESLLRLFSRKLKIPLSDQRKGIDNSPAVGCHHSLSSGDLDDTSGKFENVLHKDDAYDPEHPGFHYSTPLEVHHDSASSQEAGRISNNFVVQELVTLQKKEQIFHNCFENVEDFIPLPSPDHSDTEEAFSEFFGEKQIESGEIVDYTEPVFSVPKLPLEHFLSSGGGFNQMNMEHPFPSSHGSSYYRNDDSSVTSLPLLDASNDYQTEERSYDSEKMLSKVMYSDNCTKRASVFSRLKFDLKHMEQENQKTKPKKHETEDCNVKKRTSVFLRLTGGSEAIPQEVHHRMTTLHQKSGGLKKIKRQCALVSDDNKPEDGFKDGIAIREIMENLWQRHAN